MHPIKLVNFLKTNPGKAFLNYEHCREEESKSILLGLARRLGLSTTDGLEILKRIQARSVVLDGINAWDEEFDLRGALKAAGVNPLDRVAVNWGRFDDIDWMYLDELSLRFADVWYPGSDDIDIFDSTLTWVLTICHEGYVSVCRLSLEATDGSIPQK